MKNDIIRATCIDMSVEGQGICKSNGLVIFVKGMLIDEEADIKIISQKKNMAFAIIDKMIKPSPYRIESPCKISYKCGGCDYRYVDYDYQLTLKKHILETTFKNMDLDVVVNDVIKDDNPYYYRNKVQIPVANHEFGYYRKYSNDIVEFDNCYIQSELSNKILFSLKNKLLANKADSPLKHILIKHAFGSGEVMVCLITKTFKLNNIEKIVSELVNEFPEVKSFILNLNTREDNVILGLEEKVLYGNPYIYDVFDGIKVKISLKSFYQTNQRQMCKLYAVVKQLADIDNNTKVLDLYCGIGTISLYLAKNAKEVTGVEIVPQAIENANDNKALNNSTNCSFYLDDVTKNYDAYLNDKDVIVVDPPRKGLSKNLIDEMIKRQVKKLVYVSCNPATLARDLSYFKDYYDISNIQPVDMFPWTIHVECVVLMSRAKE